MKHKIVNRQNTPSKDYDNIINIYCNSDDHCHN